MVKKRSPQGKIILIPPIGPIIPPWINQSPGGLGPVIPPWEKPGNEPWIDYDENEKIKVKIKSVYANMFVIAGYAGYLYAVGAGSYEETIFKLIINDVNIAKIRVAGGAFVRVDKNGFLTADTDKKGATKFNIYMVNKTEYVLQDPNGYYVRVRDKDNLLVAKAENPGPKTIFKFKPVE